MLNAIRTFTTISLESLDNGGRLPPFRTLIQNQPRIGVFRNIVVSPAFPPISGGGKRPSTDLILLTADFTLFYVDEATLLKVSSNSFNGFLPVQVHSNGRRVVYLLKLFSAELEVMLKVIYDVPFLQGNSQVIWPSRFDIQNIINGIDILTPYRGKPLSVASLQESYVKYLLNCAALYPWMLCARCTAPYA
ncbi:hypothetical protein MPER_08792 [Moniliophthora perniciosa FA553]|nr:hypothetical protein MPER_08792 [Moniliophthora perniciosa FA553]